MMAVSCSTLPRPPFRSCCVDEENERPSNTSTEMTVYTSCREPARSLETRTTALCKLQLRTRTSSNDRTPSVTSLSMLLCLFRNTTVLGHRTMFALGWNPIRHELFHNRKLTTLTSRADGEPTTQRNDSCSQGLRLQTQTASCAPNACILGLGWGLDRSPK